MEILGKYSRLNSQVERLRSLLQLVPGQREPVLRRQKQKQTRLSPEELIHFCDAYRAGTPVRDLAQRFSISQHTVSEHARRQGLPMHNRLLAPEEIKEAARLYESGLSLMKIGRKLGRRGETIRQALMRSGVEIRKRNGWNSEGREPRSPRDSLRPNRQEI